MYSKQKLTHVQYIYIYTYVCRYVHTYIYIHIHNSQCVKKRQMINAPHSIAGGNCWLSGNFVTLISILAKKKEHACNTYKICTHTHIHHIFMCECSCVTFFLCHWTQSILKNHPTGAWPPARLHCCYCCFYLANYIQCALYAHTLSHQHVASSFFFPNCL